ncbi:MAG: hypothetical protein FJ405_14215, partial [Verrucomicrobia bacterium]|nr:hypothetical protein [Verrucomicrobiota bacterium]
MPGHFSALLAIACFSFMWLSLQAHAQVTLDIQIPQKQFLRNQTLPVALRIENKTGQPLKVGEQVDWLSISVETFDGKVVTPSRELIGGGQFDLAAAESVRKVVDLSESFDFSNPGTYRMTAFARFPSANQTAQSSSISFEIIRGAQLWEEVCGVSLPDGGRRVVRYSLQQAYHQKALTLFVRVADESDSVTPRVVELGPTASFSTPQATTDPAGSAHVLFQSGAKTYEYRRIDPTGVIGVREAIELTGQRPRLGRDAEGKVSVLPTPRKTP